MLRDRILTVAFATLAPSSALSELAGFLDGCRLELTVQQESCTVVHFHRCTGDPAGYQRMVTMDHDGVTMLSILDAETRWVQQRLMNSSTSEIPMEPSEDHFNHTTLREQGRDDWNFRMLQRSDGHSDSVTRYKGIATVLSETKVIDGVTMSVREIEGEIEGETSGWQASFTGTSYFEFETGREYGYRMTFTQPDGQVNNANFAPVAIAQPGSPGSGDSTPRFGCDAPLS